MDGYSELFVEIVQWAGAAGANDLSNNPGLWTGETGEAEGIGPLTVQINAHGEEIESIPAMHAAVLSGGLPVALVSPAGGAVLVHQDGGEDALIRHFKANRAMLEDDHA